jgi:hypothetical protein
MFGLRIMAYQDNIVDRGFSSGLPQAKPASRLAAGPFDVSPEHEDGASTVADALITGLLVVYPAIATVVAVVVGLSLSGSGA